MKDKLRNANSSWETFGRPKKGRFHDFETCNEGHPIMQKSYTYQAGGTVIPNANTGKIHIQ
jgi:hypothetical protein